MNPTDGPKQSKPLPPTPTGHYQVPKREKTDYRSAALLLMNRALNAFTTATAYFTGSKSKIPASGVTPDAKPTKNVAMQSGVVPVYQQLPTDPSHHYGVLPLGPPGTENEIFQSAVITQHEPARPLKEHAFKAGPPVQKPLPNPIYAKLTHYKTWHEEIQDAQKDFSTKCKKEKKEGNVVKLSTLRLFAGQISELKKIISRLEPESKREKALQEIQSCQVKLYDQVQESTAYFIDKFRKARIDGYPALEVFLKVQNIVAKLNDVSDLAGIKDKKLTQSISVLDELKSDGLSKTDFATFQKKISEHLTKKASNLTRLIHYDHAMQSPWISPAQRKLCADKGIAFFNKRVLAEMSKSDISTNLKIIEAFVNFKPPVSDELREYFEKAALDLLSQKFKNVLDADMKYLRGRKLCENIITTVKHIMTLDKYAGALQLPNRAKAGLIDQLNKHPVRQVLANARDKLLAQTAAGKSAEQAIRSYINGEESDSGQKEIARYILAELGIEHVNNQPGFRGNENLELLRQAFLRPEIFITAVPIKDQELFSQLLFDYQAKVAGSSALSALYRDAYAAEAVYLQSAATFKNSSNSEKPINFLQFDVDAEAFFAAVEKIRAADQTFITEASFKRGFDIAVLRLHNREKYGFVTPKGIPNPESDERMRGTHD